MTENEQFILEDIIANSPDKVEKLSATTKLLKHSLQLYRIAYNHGPTENDWPDIHYSKALTIALHNGERIMRIADKYLNEK